MKPILLLLTMFLSINLMGQVYQPRISATKNFGVDTAAVVQIANLDGSGAAGFKSIVPGDTMVLLVNGDSARLTTTANLSINGNTFGNDGTLKILPLAGRSGRTRIAVDSTGQIHWDTTIIGGQSYLDSTNGTLHPRDINSKFTIGKAVADAMFDVAGNVQLTYHDSISQTLGHDTISVMGLNIPIEGHMQKAIINNRLYSIGTYVNGFSGKWATLQNIVDSVTGGGVGEIFAFRNDSSESAQYSIGFQYVLGQDVHEMLLDREGFEFGIGTGGVYKIQERISGNDGILFRVHPTDSIAYISGDLGIGLASPTAPLHISSGNVVALSIDGASNEAATAAGIATLNNSPVTGDPDTYMVIRLNGTEYIIPAWIKP